MMYTKTVREPPQTTPVFYEFNKTQLKQILIEYLVAAGEKLPPAKEVGIYISDSLHHGHEEIRLTFDKAIGE